MCNSCSNGGQSSLVSALENLFGPPRLPQSGCGCSADANFTNGFLSGVNAANAANGTNGCGCNGGNSGGCGCNADPYYAQQYALAPSSCGCSLGGNTNVYGSGAYNSGYYY